MSGSDRLVTVTVSIARNGDVYDDTVTHGNTYADVYSGLVQVRAEIDRQITQRRACPYNPKYGNMDHD